MFLTEEARHRIIVYSLPRYKVTGTPDGFWRVQCGTEPVAVFGDWRDAFTFAHWKATT